VQAGEVVYHYNARESRFVGRSVAAADAVTDTREDAYTVELAEFTPIVAPVDLAFLRANADALYDMRDRLRAMHAGPLYLPFQFRSDRRQLRMLNNYFARMPRELVKLLFGSDGLATDLLRAAPPDDAPPEPGDSEIDVGRAPGSFLNPFKPKADSAYSVVVRGGRKTRTRKHEKLVNDCATWLETKGIEPARNAAVDLGSEDPSVIIEGKTVGPSVATAVRQAVSQLYEYRCFKVADPHARLILLASEPIPDVWVEYLEQDREIGVMWPKGNGYQLSKLARKALRL
jgi:hypothetical protein